MITADPALLREIKKIRDAGRFMQRFCKMKERLSTTKAPDIYADMVREDRVAVLVCTAATLLHEPERHPPEYIDWARSIICTWANEFQRRSLTIADGLHPTRIDSYAGPYIRATTIREEGI